MFIKGPITYGGGNYAQATFRLHRACHDADGQSCDRARISTDILLNAAFPAREGTNTTGQKDANGKLFHHDFIQMAESKGSGWVDYMFPKPGQTQASRKWAYVKAVNVDGVPSLVASGFYPE
jgi:hypothetical protein